jgi:hypothetical protein
MRPRRIVTAGIAGTAEVEPDSSELAESFAPIDTGTLPAPSPDPGVEGSAATPRSRRRRWLFVLLGVATGYLGLHNFYAGCWTRGASQLALSVLTTWLGFGWFLTWTWALAEVVFVRRDGACLEMK